MLVSYSDGDRALCRKANEILDKKLEKLREGLEELGLASLVVQTEQGRLGRARELVEIEDEEVEWPREVAETQRCALRLLRSKLLDVAEGQTKLLVVPDDTNEKVQMVDDLRDRLSGQESLFGRPVGVGA